MSNTTLARPYAKAVFELALADNKLEAWQQMLHDAGAVIANNEVVDLLQNPQLTSIQTAQFFIELCDQQLDINGQNFIKLLAQNHRLLLLAEISELYADYVTQHQHKADVKIISARTLTDAQQNALSEALKNYLKREITLTSAVDSNLLGGAVIHVGDRVIDGSLRSRLNRLRETLQH